MKRIQHSVGRDGVNQLGDVLVIQQLLNAQSIIGFTTPLKVDGIAKSQTINRIEAFQRNNMNMLNPDGRVDPDGKTY